MKLKSFKFELLQIRADSSTCISWLVRGALCRYANRGWLTGFYRTKTVLMRRKGTKMPVCGSVYTCVNVSSRTQAKKKKGVAVIPPEITKIFNLPFMTSN